MTLYQSISISEEKNSRDFAIISFVVLKDTKHKFDSLLVGVFRRDIVYMIRKGFIKKILKATYNVDCGIN